MIIIQVDDSLVMGTYNFLADEKQAVRNVKCKPRTILTKKTLTFNGSDLLKVPFPVVFNSIPGW